MLLLATISILDLLAQDADTTTLSLSGSTMYMTDGDRLEGTVVFGASFVDTTYSMSGTLGWDETVRFSGMTVLPNSGLPDSLKLSEFNYTYSSGQVRFAFATTEPIVLEDSLILFHFVPIENGTFEVNLSFMEFDEREPRNDGWNWLPAILDSRPISEYLPSCDSSCQYPGDEWIMKNDVHDVIRQHYLLRTQSLDVNCSGPLSDGTQYTTLDAQYLLRRVLDPNIPVPVLEPTLCSTPIHEELR